MRCTASSRITACTVIGSHLVVLKASSYDDHLIVAGKSNLSTGSHEPTQGSPACSVHATGSTSVKLRSTRVEPALYGAHITQAKEYPRAAYTLRGSHTSSQRVPTCSLRYGAHTSQVRSYPRVSALRGLRKSKQGLPTWSASYGVYTSPFTGLDTRIVPIYLKFVPII